MSEYSDLLSIYIHLQLLKCLRKTTQRMEYCNLFCLMGISEGVRGGSRTPAEEPLF